MKTEIWKDILGYEGLYQISNLGRVKSLTRTKSGKYGSIRPVKERILKPTKDNKGYFLVHLYNNSSGKTLMVHRIVASAFIPNPQGLPQVNHKDENKANNCVDNLEYCTPEYNSNYGTRNKKVSKSLINNSKRSKSVLCVETGVIYSSTKEVQRQLGYSGGHISKCCNGRLKTAYGYHWQYVEKKKEVV